MNCLTLKPVYKSNGRLVRIEGSCATGLDPKLARYGPWTQTLQGANVYKIWLEGTTLHVVLTSKWVCARPETALRLAPQYLSKKLWEIKESLVSQRGDLVPTKQWVKTLTSKAERNKVRKRVRAAQDFLSAQSIKLMDIYVTI